MKILIVDDDFTNRLVLQKLLSRYGECHIAVNGKEAVAVVTNAVTEKVPHDLILLDIMMPEMDGSEALQQIRKMEEEAGVRLGNGAKIIMVTSVDDRKKIIQSFSDQCEGYLVKPASVDSLENAMRDAGVI